MLLLLLCVILLESISSGGQWKIMTLREKRNLPLLLRPTNLLCICLLTNIKVPFCTFEHYWKWMTRKCTSGQSSYISVQVTRPPKLMARRKWEGFAWLGFHAKDSSSEVTIWLLRLPLGFPFNLKNGCMDNCH